MKRHIRAGILALSLSALPLSLAATAQTTGYQGERGGTTYGTTERNRDWGWIGLLGLIGLAGLMRRREEPTRHRAADYRTGETLGSR